VALITTPEATAIIGCATRVHSALGAGLFESVYEQCLAVEFLKAGLSFQRQVTLPVRYEGFELQRAFVADFIVESSVLVELKSIDRLLTVHSAQVLTYMRLAGLKKGLLINFNTAHLRDGIKSFVR
jgi:GxxExxY protein